MNQDKISLLKDYFQKNPEVVFAFLFGSQAKKIAGKISDWDIAVYFRPQEDLEWEETERQYPQENKIWNDLIDILETDNVDLIILNRAPSNIAASAITEGTPLIIRDRGLFLDFMLVVTKEAEDFTEFMEDYLKIKISSQSLAEESRTRLIQRLDYLLTYWPEKEKLLKLDFDTYKNEPVQRRNLERWVENIANATIDIAKIILASEKKQMPKSYKEALLDLGFLFGLNEQEAKKFSEVANLRNILAHEYLDILYARIKDFLLNISPFYEKLIAFLKGYI